jgi:ubiquinol-cytochrome c reductase cytochrome b subunit
MLFLYLWPVLERKATGDYGYHNLLDRPRDAPWRTAIGLAVLTWTSFVFFAGASDRVDVLFGLSYTAQIWVYRVLVWVLPVVVGAIAYRVCIELQRGEHVERERKRAEAEARAASA